MTRTRMMGTFFAVTALVSWAPLALVARAGFETPIGRAVSIFYSFGPLVAALVVQGPLLKKPVLEPLGINRDLNRFWLVAWLAPLLALAVGVLATAIIDGIAPVLTVDGVIASTRARVPHEHLAEPGAADLLRALAYPQERDRRAAVVRVEPQVDRLETGRDVGLVVARPARPDRAVA